MKKLADQVAIVTGAASGIGRELAKQLSGAGCHLALVDLDETGLKDLQQELTDKPATVSIHKADVGEEEAIRKLVDDVVGIHQRVSILINNAKKADLDLIHTGASAR